MINIFLRGTHSIGYTHPRGRSSVGEGRGGKPLVVGRFGYAQWLLDNYPNI